MMLPPFGAKVRTMEDLKRNEVAQVRPSLRLRSEPCDGIEPHVHCSRRRKKGNTCSWQLSQPCLRPGHTAPYPVQLQPSPEDLQAHSLAVFSPVALASRQQNYQDTCPARS